jgi:hypothetical protein
MIELNDFYNSGFGWICRQCEQDLVPAEDAQNLSRMFREGEAESRSPRLYSAAIAKWADATRTMLTCPRCGITEPIEKG